MSSPVFGSPLEALLWTVVNSLVLWLILLYLTRRRGVRVLFGVKSPLGLFQYAMLVCTCASILAVLIGH